MNPLDNVGRWMTTNPVTIDEKASIIEAIHLMKDKEIRRLPVTRDGKFTGLITDRMIKEYSPSKATALDTWELHYVLAKTSVAEAMNPHPHTVTPEQTLTAAAQAIIEHKLYGLCVVDGKGDLVGILTTTDLLRALVALCAGQGSCPR